MRRFPPQIRSLECCEQDDVTHIHSPCLNALPVSSALEESGVRFVASRVLFDPRRHGYCAPHSGSIGVVDACVPAELLSSAQYLHERRLRSSTSSALLVEVLQC